MHNLFVNGDFFDWSTSGSPRLRWANRVLEKAGRGARLRQPGSTGYMTSVETRINLYHLVSQVLAYGVRGDLMEVGTYIGSTAALVQWVIDGEGHGQQLHIYDSFEKSWGVPDPLDTLERNLQKYCATLPVIHVGRFEETIPSQLPEAISFINIDCGCGNPTDEHVSVMKHVLDHVYPRLTAGGICSLIDYWKRGLHDELDNPNPGVQIAVDRFLMDKPEEVSVLFAHEIVHAYFRKM